ncbi:hypothetical protein [Paenibacillus sp. PL91]|uniref:hypothetical protein n=1 Tax=Paenibacillus sp. PL91 TaxID=2729538 RepID=UPI00145F3926|nr:hypothetical protein [Paenibacillus sp. PL91]MBC9205178.1 hypothetical protein [Paenibacillus sp. PL91]
MKRRMMMIGLLVIVLCAIFIVYKKTFPRSIDVTLTGVKYQLGAAGERTGTEPATVIIKGKLYTKLNGKRTFKGEVNIVGEQIPVPLDQRKLEIPFSNEGWGAMSYPYFIYGERGAVVRTEIHQSHLIFANRDFTQVSFLIADHVQGQKGENSQTIWNTENGYMLSVPATTREEALAISNKLMRDYLKTYGPLQ